MIDLDNHFNSIKSIICLNGEIPSKKFFMRQSNLPIIAADGAANTLIFMGIVPTLIIGDLDSIDSEIIPNSVEVLHIAEQNSTDFEKCLRVLEERKLFPCLVYGATGKELDHTLYNINIIAEHSLRDHIIFHDSAYKAKEKYGIFVRDAMIGNLIIGSKISLLSLSPSIVSTNGLTWELSQMNLSPKISSVRNSIKFNPVEIIVHSGSVLVLFDFIASYAPR